MRLSGHALSSTLESGTTIRYAVHAECVCVRERESGRWHTVVFLMLLEPCQIQKRPCPTNPRNRCSTTRGEANTAAFGEKTISQQTWDRARICEASQGTMERSTASRGEESAYFKYGVIRFVPVTGGCRRISAVTLATSAFYERTGFRIRTLLASSGRKAGIVPGHRGTHQPAKNQ